MLYFFILFMPYTSFYRCFKLITEFESWPGVDVLKDPKCEEAVLLKTLNENVY